MKHLLAQPVVTAGGHEKGRSQSRKAPFRGFGDRDLESRDASSPDSRNAKSRKRFMDKRVVTAIGHIDGRWRKKLEVLSSISESRRSRC
jgi:hypothetical protein